MAAPTYDELVEIIGELRELASKQAEELAGKDCRNAELERIIDELQRPGKRQAGRRDDLGPLPALVPEVRWKNQFWGDRSRTFTDPHGYAWSIAMHKGDLTRQEIKQRQDECMKQLRRRPERGGPNRSSLVELFGPPDPEDV